MKNWLYFIIALFSYMMIHEGLHAVIALFFNEYNTIKMNWYGPEVVNITSVEERIPGIKWFVISGFSNFITLLTGYLLFILKRKIVSLKHPLIRSILYYIAIVFLLFDAVNLSLGPFLFGGDINGIAAGLKIKSWIIQIFFGAVLLLNRELIVKFMESFSVSSGSILFKSWHHK